MDFLTTKIYGLIGYPLGHSFSQNFFNQKFRSEGINSEYINFEISSIDELESVVARNPNLHGLNVTIPYKEQVIPYLQDLDETAAEIGAVNVIKINRNQRGEIVSLTGYNSDCIGFVDSIRAYIKPHHRQSLVLGTGGAAKAVAYGLKTLGVTPIFVSRTKGEGRLTYEGLKLHPELLSQYTVIVNATPIGMYPNVNDCPDLPYEFLSPQHLCYDVIYNPDETMFMKRSAQYGAQVKNGLEMLLMQAFAAWNIWNE